MTHRRIFKFGKPKLTGLGSHVELYFESGLGWNLIPYPHLFVMTAENMEMEKRYEIDFGVHFLKWHLFMIVSKRVGV